MPRRSLPLTRRSTLAVIAAVAMILSLMNEAIKAYEVAAQAGHWKAVRSLATLYTYGIPGGGVGTEQTIKPNASRAIEYTQRLIKMNVATGNHTDIGVGDFLVDGTWGGISDPGSGGGAAFVAY
jgi:TPR repeat protein